MRSWFPLLLLLHVGYPPRIFAHFVCGSKDIRNTVDNLSKLDNCTIIEGYLWILLIEARAEDYHGLQFPNLVEVTDYVLFYRAKGLESLGQLFPSLAVIRGNKLFQNYALVVFEMSQLHEIALPSLTSVLRGGIRVEKNPRLCHVDTVNWKALAPAGVEVNFFKENGEPSCPYSCPPAEVCRPWDKEDDSTSCWNSTLCQKQCPQECSSCMTVEEQPVCCHQECLGGCTGPTTANCTACRNVFYNGRCLSKCPVGTFMYLQWRCVSEPECHQLGPHWKTIEGQCVPECPAGYMEKPGDPHLCVACATHCPKVCIGLRVDSTAAVQKLKGCTIIKGSLEIHLRTGGRNLLEELKESLQLLEEITGALKVTRSILITSLNFLPNLTSIHANTKDVSDNYSLVVRDNPNLEALWDWSTRTAPLRILRGLVMIEQNPRLCPHNVEQLWRNARLPPGVNLPPPHVLELNGDMVACEVQDMELTLLTVGSHHAMIRWRKSRNLSKPLLGYVLYYRQIDVSGLLVKPVGPGALSYSYTLSREEEKNISRFDGTCGSDLWKVVDIPLGGREDTHMTHPLTHLQPFTSYVMYVRTDLGRQGAHSPLVVFRTAPAMPSPPRQLRTHPTSPSDAVFTWLPPSHPNGRIHHYVVEGVKIPDSPLPDLDYCQEMPPPLHVEPTPRSVEITTSSLSLPSREKCCSCREAPSLSTPFEDIVYDSFTKHLGEEPDGSGGGHCRDNSSTSSFCQVVHQYPFVVASNLLHFSQYLAKVRACIVVNESVEDRFLCSSPALITVRTLPEGGGDDVIRFWRKDNATVVIEWEPPPKPNGILLAYHIKYSSLSSKQEVMACIPWHAEPWWELPHALGAGNFSLQLRAVSLAGPGNWTTPLYFHISPHSDGSSAGLSTVLPVVISIILLAGVAVMVLFFLRFKMEGKRGHGGILIASVNPEYMSSHLVYEPDEWEVDRDRVALLQSLGQGSFGQVFAGELQMPDGPSLSCAVKVAHVNQSHSEFSQLREKMDFLAEATVMKGFGCHHVVRLLGVVSRGQPTLVLMELMEHGDLKSYLRTCRSQPPVPQRIFTMAAQVADGMAYLASCKFVHRDLAARNCMVAADLTVKIGDFGMARDIYETDYYRRGVHHEAHLPVRWMAPESLRDGVFTSRSDVWSYGVVLWEIATLAAQPYQGLSNEEVVSSVQGGSILDEPPDCPPLLYGLMKQCWQWQAKLRPSFPDIVEQLLPRVADDFCQVSFCASLHQQHHTKNLANGYLS